MLLHYEPPLPPSGPATLVQDAGFLQRNRTFEGGATLIARYSGLMVGIPEQRLRPARRPPALQLSQRRNKNLSPAIRSSGSPARSPLRFLSPQKGLENLFQEVSGNLQKRTEGWKVAKAVQAAASEVRRNMDNLQSGTASPRNSLDATQAPPSERSAKPETGDNLRQKLSMLERRNQALARMLADALEEIRAYRESSDAKEATVLESTFNTALAKMQFVQVYLADSEIPIPEPNTPQIVGLIEEQPSTAETEEDPTPIPMAEDSDASTVAIMHDDLKSQGLVKSSIVGTKNPISRPKAESAEAVNKTKTANKESLDGKLKPCTVSPPRTRPLLHNHLYRGSWEKGNIVRTLSALPYLLQR